ncbi:MAG: tyrosine-type recombinase/integrase [Leptolyngbyaceae cyanobacterium SM1_4_3]|nr:tyrosine-type recombinase/integrase [Leptolyngbyaceae cyanobacterium SM1_4_3]
MVNKPILNSSNSVTYKDVRSAIPSIVLNAGEQASRRFIEFFLVSIRNENTRAAYAQAIRQFLEWCEGRGMGLTDISSLAIAAYIERHPGSPPTVNQHLSAIRSLFAWLVEGQVLSSNPGAEVQGVKHRVKCGKTPVLSDEEMVELLGGIDTSSIIGLRDRALIGMMFYSFARISAVLGMNVKDYFPKGKRYWFRLHEKGGRYHELPVHHKAEEYLDLYLDEAGLREQKDAPLFQTSPGKSRKLTGDRLQRQEAWAMIKRRAEIAGVSTDACNHSFRASGITNFLRNGGSRDSAQRIAAHEDIRTTALYDRRGDAVSLDEIERIRL